MPELKSCVVCGSPSHRKDWKNRKAEFVACDSHSTGEFEDAIKKAVANPQSTEAQNSIPPIEQRLGITPQK